MLEARIASSDRYRMLLEYARENRKNATQAEAIMWHILRNKKLGVSFLRQYIIDDFIVDFACRENGLIIEIDGAYHSEVSQKEDDKLRTERLNGLGFNVIRFTNEQVICDIDSVIEEIEKYLE